MKERIRTKCNPRIAKLKIELMAIVLTNIKRPSSSEMNATKQTARKGVLFLVSTRMNLEPGSP
jgi:hypothetical protein